MRRRTLITLLGGAASWPLVVRGQQPANPMIGLMSSRSVTDSVPLFEAFHRGLGEAGYFNGQNAKIEYRWANGRYERLPALATELVGLQVAVIVTFGGSPAARAAKAATSTTPIVFSVGSDPVKLGLVASFNRPAGNATGVGLLTTELEAKRLGLMHELVPKAALVSVLINPINPPSVDQAREVQQAALSIDQRLQILYASTPQELDSAFAVLVRQRADGLLVGADPFFDTQRDRIVEFAAQQRLPALYQFREYAVAGGLMSYGVNITDGYHQVGAYAGRILKGEKPADLPVVQPTRFEFVINLQTARMLGLEIPPTLLARADEVIE
jgi:putative ABC transport system substrate-binding protein